MATLVHLADQERLIIYRAPLRRDQLPDRMFYLLPTALKWMQEKLPGLNTWFENEVSPLEQVDLFLTKFCAGDTLTFERQFHSVHHVDDGIWELKTIDVRMFGWFHARDRFVCTNGGDATVIKSHGLVPGFRDEAVRLRTDLDLDEPKFVKGNDPNEVVSAFSYP